MTLREILKNMIQKHMAYPDKTAYKIADKEVASIRSVLLKELPQRKELSENDPSIELGYNQYASEAREVVERICS